MRCSCSASRVAQVAISIQARQLLLGEDTGIMTARRHLAGNTENQEAHDWRSSSTQRWRIARFTFTCCTSAIAPASQQQMVDAQTGRPVPLARRSEGLRSRARALRQGHPRGNRAKLSRSRPRAQHQPIRPSQRDRSRSSTSGRTTWAPTVIPPQTILRWRAPRKQEKSRHRELGDAKTLVSRSADGPPRLPHADHLEEPRRSDSARASSTRRGGPPSRRRKRIWPAGCSTNSPAPSDR